MRYVESILRESSVNQLPQIYDKGLPGISKVGLFQAWNVSFCKTIKA